MEQEDESMVDRISITINSGNRCAKHNKDEGGSARSRHITGEAADFRMQYVMQKRDTKGRLKRRMVDPTAVANYLDHKYPNEYDVGWYHGRTHFDVSKSGRRRWDVR
jgi:Peptidase M15.